MPKYTYSDTSNSYFGGRDLRIGREDDGRVITVAVKNDYWALNVKSDWIRMTRSENVREAADKLSEAKLESIEAQVKESFWQQAEELATSHIFGGTIFQEGRSGGWLAVEETGAFEALHPSLPLNEAEEDDIERWLGYCFAIHDLQEVSEKDFDNLIVQAAKELAERKVCPNCATTFEDGLFGEEHVSSACVLGALLGVAIDRAEVELDEAKAAAIDSTWLWNEVGPMVDAIEKEAKK